jgi:pimeloyl-ACP methyl ester carboxylesterase
VEETTMQAPSTTTADVRTLSVPGAELTYDVRGDLSAATEAVPALMLIGTPMAAEGFVTLAESFDDRPVITYDPRNTGRSRSTTGLTPTPENHAADLHAIVTALQPELGSPRIDLFGSSGGAINALALVAAHPEDLRVVVAHEPPSSRVLPDAAVLVAACADVLDGYRRAGFGLGLAKFIALVSEQGPLAPEYLDRPDPDPAAFGLPTTDDGSRDDPLMANMATIPVWGPDLDALRSASCRVVLAVGEDSGETMAARAPRAIAAALGRAPVTFPGDHAGFAGGELGQMGKPSEFAATLREVLA